MTQSALKFWQVIIHAQPTEVHPEYWSAEFMEVIIFCFGYNSEMATGLAFSFLPRGLYTPAKSEIRTSEVNKFIDTSSLDESIQNAIADARLTGFGIAYVPYTIGSDIPPGVIFDL